MKLSQLFVKEAMMLSLKTTTKQQTLMTLAQNFADIGGVTDVKSYVAALERREAQSTTGVGDEIAIPHAQDKTISKATIIFGRSEEGIEWNSFDGQAAKLIFMIAAPEGGSGEHLQALSKLSSVLMNPEAKTALLAATTPDEVVRVFERYERTKEEMDDKISHHNDAYILAVTACPTGIAHTFMAEEKLKQAGKKAGVNIKVETNGQGGIENKLTSEDIEKATAIIVAADKNVEMNRFKGKHVIITKVADGINHAEKLVDKAIKKEAPVYLGNDKTDIDEEMISGESFGRQIYKHLMNGVSHMLPFVVAGGLLIALSFFWGINAFDPTSKSYNEFADLIFSIGKFAFSMMLPVLAGYIGQSIADRPGLVVGFIGGIIANPSILSFTGRFGHLESSGFLGALVAGFLAGGIILALRKAFSWMPKSLEGTKPILIFPVLGSLLIGLLMFYVFNAPLAAIMSGIQHFIESMSGTSKIILGFILGSMMAIDMGGPFNKAAYVTGTALLASSGSAGSDVMAAVMAAGMVPPLAIFLSAMINRNLWPQSQRPAAITNLFMGAAFITEGAIPFAASSPLRVIPALMIASGTTGAISMYLGIVSLVPHGGLFAVAFGGVVGGYIAGLKFCLCIIIGMIVGAILLNVLLKNQKNN